MVLVLVVLVMRAVLIFYQPDPELGECIQVRAAVCKMRLLYATVH